MTRKEITFLKKYNTLLHNKYVLFFVLFVAILNLGAFVYTTDLKSVGIFFLTGLLTSYFSKSMVVILVVAMVVANIIRQNSGLEGFKRKKGLKMKKRTKKAKKKIKKIVCDEDDEECIEAREEAEQKGENIRDKITENEEEVPSDDE